MLSPRSLSGEKIFVMGTFSYKMNLRYQSCQASPSSSHLVIMSLPSSAPTKAIGDVEELSIEEKAIAKTNIAPASDDSNSTHLQPVPLKWKLASVVLVTAIGFGSQWSSGITSAMKTTMKKEMKINNTQFSLLEASEDFMVTALMLVSGLVTDRIGGAGASSLPQ
jgi:hypothetical protein